MTNNERLARKLGIEVQENRVRENYYFIVDVGLGGASIIFDPFVENIQKADAAIMRSMIEAAVVGLGYSIHQNIGIADGEPYNPVYIFDADGDQVGFYEGDEGESPLRALAEAAEQLPEVKE